MIDTENPLNERDCWLCGADVPRMCWCHDPTATYDDRPCKCNGKGDDDND